MHPAVLFPGGSLEPQGSKCVCLTPSLAFKTNWNVFTAHSFCSRIVMLNCVTQKAAFHTFSCAYINLCLLNCDILETCW